MAAPTEIPTATNEPYVVENCGILKLMSDGSVIRSPNPPVSSTLPDDGSVEWKDLLFNSTHSLYVRLYRPVDIQPNTKLPILVFFHGGGFCNGSRTWPNFHAVCRRLSSELSTLVLSFDYRLAPEHRLPAGIEDAMSALLWIKSQCMGPNSDPWLMESGDLTKVFISGESAGGTFAHHMAVKFGPNGLSPVKIRGFILLQPALLEEEPTRSELECPESAFLNREGFDQFGRLELLAEATRDYPVLNPFGSESPNLVDVDMGPLLVVVSERDIMLDNNVNYVNRLKEMGKEVEMVHIEGEEQRDGTDERRERRQPCSHERRSGETELRRRGGGALERFIPSIAAKGKEPSRS